MENTELVELIKKSVKQAIENYNNGLLNEMALSRSSYKNKIDNVFPQILINWCLVRYCTLTDREETKEHWKGELRGYIGNVASYSIKGENSKKNAQKVLKEIWEDNDYNLSNVINLVVFNKFLSEDIDLMSDAYAETILDCIKAKGDIINTILSKDRQTIIDYVETI